MKPAKKQTFIAVDGNEAAARVAHLLSEVIAIYPITPASLMGELAESWSREGRRNLWGQVPEVVEMQSEAGAAGTLHGALQAGALATTFTASQGLLLMIPDMYKIAGELVPAVIHVAARTVATHALSIFCDHSDVMAVRATGWAMLCSTSVQEAQDLAAVAHLATLESRVPFLHFFDGFRTSHEVASIERLEEDELRMLLDDAAVKAHRDRALDPEHPTLRGSAQNPDVFFQAREASNPYHLAVPGIVERAMERFASITGRSYDLCAYAGAPDAERVIVVMGSAAGAVTEAVDSLTANGEKVGVLTVHLYRPFPVTAFVATLPATTRRVAVLDRTKEPGAVGEPLYQDVLAALVENRAESNGDTARAMPRVIAGRYGLASKELTPAMAAAIFAELDRPEPRQHFTIGIHDDVTGLSLRFDPNALPEPDDVFRAVFFALGGDGSVGAAKSTVKIVGENGGPAARRVQSYSLYDSKKSGSLTVSHLRFSPRPIHATYLPRDAQFVACNQFHLLERAGVLAMAAPGATVLLNSPYPAATAWSHLPAAAREQIVAKRLRLFVVDAYAVARAAGLGPRINTVMQTCFFALTDLVPIERAVKALEAAVAKTYDARHPELVARNLDAVARARDSLAAVEVPAAELAASSDAAAALACDRATVEARAVAGALAAVEARAASSPDAAAATDFVRHVTSFLLAGQGDLLPVSALPVDGTFPTGTARFEQRSIAEEIPIWDADLCIECGLCALVCPHAAIRMKAYPAATLEGAAAALPSRPWHGRELLAPPGEDWRMTIQVFPDDCTGCAICVDVCPAKSKSDPDHRAIDMESKAPHLERERHRLEAFLRLPDAPRSLVRADTVKGSQLLEPLFEASGACAGCGETPYLKLLSQLFGDRLMIANATGCSSIYGGNLPTTPWSANHEGRGPAWANSLFEDNAEFGLGMRLALDQREGLARQRLVELRESVGAELTDAIISAKQTDEVAIEEQRARVEELRRRCAELGTPEAAALADSASSLVRRSVWIVGGDGWAYDIGFGGVDHVLASNRDVNLLVLDTEVYSNTGGQSSKATPRGAVAKFAAAGKSGRKKDLGLIAMGYGNVYVAQVALGANPLQTIRALRQAESYPGPSLVIAYSHCIAHGIDMSQAMHHQHEAVDCGYWPLYHYDPRTAGDDGLPFRLDSRAPNHAFQEFALSEGRFSTLARVEPERSKELLDLAQADIDQRRRVHEQMAGIKADDRAPSRPRGSPAA